MWFDVAAGGTLFTTLIPFPHPEAAHMPIGVFAPSLEELDSAGAHIIVAGTDLPGSVRDRAAALLRLTAAVLRSTDAVAAMPWHGGSFNRADLFYDLAARAVDGDSIPTQLAVGFTVEAMGENRASILTGGLARFGREELLVTTMAGRTDGVDFAFAIAGWLLDDPGAVVPTGDTVGRTADERVLVQRVAHPTNSSATVILLDLPR